MHEVVLRRQGQLTREHDTKAVEETCAEKALLLRH